MALLNGRNWTIADLLGRKHVQNLIKMMEDWVIEAGNLVAKGAVTLVR